DLPDGFEESLYADGLNLPTSMEFTPDGRILVAQQSGDIRVVDTSGNTLGTPFLSLAVNKQFERGVLGLAVDPDFENTGYVYVFYTPESTPEFNRLSRFTVSLTGDGNTADPASEVILMGDIPTPSGWHNGGGIHFGADGMLYIGVGDGFKSDPENPINLAQDLDALGGKVLRLDVNNYPNIIPADNPFVNNPNARPEVYALGLRNPFTSAVDPVTGRMVFNDVGDKLYEESNEVTAPGQNFGWPIHEGPVNQPGFTDPLYAYAHVNGGSASITGGTFYRGTGASAFPPEYEGDLFLADYLNQWIRVVDAETGAVSDFATGVQHALDLDVGPDGALYYMSVFTTNGSTGFGRQIYRIGYVGDSNRRPTAVATADTTAGLTPLDVNFSAEGSFDPDGDTLNYVWTFGDGNTATGRDVLHTYQAAGTYTAYVTVDDGNGGTADSLPITVTVGNERPVPTINSPAADTPYVGGQTVTVTGSAFDNQDGQIPAGSLDWSVVFHHLDHTHPFIPSISGTDSITFTIPDAGETSPIVWYR
ncbi:MAG: PQQ-dependent sugar dehydrogenase, partial [Planctomycetota bacterium]